MSKARAIFVALEVSRRAAASPGRWLRGCLMSRSFPEIFPFVLWRRSVWLYEGLGNDGCPSFGRSTEEGGGSPVGGALFERLTVHPPGLGLLSPNSPVSSGVRLIASSAWTQVPVMPWRRSLAGWTQRDWSSRPRRGGSKT